jgi:8-oxo-dGTP pyrophosphatase MutT (NUDIX family)
MHKKVMPGKWTIPGGGLSVDDYINTPASTGADQWYGALEKSLRREIKEEVNLEIGKPEFLVDLTFIRPDGVPVICFSYFAPYVSGEVVIDEDATEFAWVTLDQAKQYDLIEGIWDEIRQIDEILKRGKTG